MSEVIDWASVKERLRKSDLALKHAFEKSGKDLGEALRMRATVLAQRRRPDGREKTMELLTFRLASCLYGWPLTDLAGVRHFDRVTPLPEAPAELLGVVSHRGGVLPLLSLKRILSGSSDEQEKAGHAVILKNLGVACRVDELEGLAEIAFDAIQPIDPGERHGSPIVGIGPGDLRILSADTFARHSYFQTQEERL